MLIDISELKRTGEEFKKIELQKVLESPLEWQGEKILFLSPIKVEGTIKLTNERLVSVQGNFKAEIEVQCSRCLKNVETNLKGELEGEFIPLGIASEEELEEEFQGQFYSGDILDLNGLLLENITFALPMQFLCSEDCGGLCEFCGVKVNEVDCNCEKEQIDPRLEVLKKLLKGSNSEGRVSDGSTKEKTIKIKEK